MFMISQHYVNLQMFFFQVSVPKTPFYMDNVLITNEMNEFL